ncbi:hypothetical protein SYNTR_1809 [Candidatus Syntrophocurvum alkaliphilum]|uniref:Uncharacterized protein n=1 Tax=Candidatus Syntrophocurvum alkaliphilum TaxID=2293317 RepID=A0A6I6DH36_9FIRM|nr:hypothetical protein [Candidatus Syntrophocurvum alkaliphilum]QGU00403.1 hypothetical protein SYNTR_1809 [Candidatus Syntrophocurvum alkaliphilum]
MTTIILMSAGVGLLVAGTIMFMMAKVNAHTSIKQNGKKEVKQDDDNNQNQLRLNSHLEDEPLDDKREPSQEEPDVAIDKKIILVIKILMSFIIIIGIAGTVYFLLDKEYGFAFLLSLLAITVLGLLFSMLGLIKSFNKLAKQFGESIKNDDTYYRR